MHQHPSTRVTLQCANQIIVQLLSQHSLWHAGRPADVVQAATTALEAAIRLIRPGSRSSDVSATLQKVSLGHALARDPHPRCYVLWEFRVFPSRIGASKLSQSTARGSGAVSGLDPGHMPLPWAASELRSSFGRQQQGGCGLCLAAGT